jgi:hypothetical protein
MRAFAVDAIVQEMSVAEPSVKSSGAKHLREIHTVSPKSCRKPPLDFSAMNDLRPAQGRRMI